MQIVERVEKQLIRKENVFFSMLKEYCHLAKNLYNQGNYLIRQEFLKDDNTFLGYKQVDKLCKMNNEYPDYKNMPTAQMAQQILRKLEDNWRSFFKANKEWKKNPSKFTGRPRPPKYLDKDGETTIYLTNQNCKLKNDGLIHFPKVFQIDGTPFVVKPTQIDTDFVSFQQVQIKPHKDYLELFIIYRIEIPEVKKDSERYLFIDLGIDNFATVVNNFGETNLLIDGKGLKAKNQWFNKIIASVQSSLKVINGKEDSNKLQKLWLKRNNVIMDELHKKSRQIVDYADRLNVSKVVIGHNKRQKDSSGLSRQFNQNFVQIPHARFIDLLRYKLEERGIELIEVEESYTSKCSFIDFDKLPTKLVKKAPKFSGERINRGLYKTKDGHLINADVNGAYNIGRKAQKQLKGNLKDLSDRVEWLVSSPVRLKTT